MKIIVNLQHPTNNPLGQLSFDTSFSNAWIFTSSFWLCTSHRVSFADILEPKCEDLPPFENIYKKVFSPSQSIPTHNIHHHYKQPTRHLLSQIFLQRPSTCSLPPPSSQPSSPSPWLPQLPSRATHWPPMKPSYSTVCVIHKTHTHICKICH